ncbi:putative SWI/SNF-related matrix-associated actin-dependent regulator of chromatin subfamily A member 3-like 1 [Nicotiana tabacum]
MESEAKRIVKQYISSDSSMKNYWTVLSVIVRLRQICIDLALCPSDLRSLLPSNKIGDVHSNPQLLDKMLSALQDDEGIDCPICIFPPTDSVITCCGHIFCKSCILKTIKRAKPCCPLCRHPLSESDLFFCPPEASNAANSGSSSTASSKVKALLKLLCASRDESSNRKSIVFSQFRKMLLLLEEPLKAAGFKILRLDGSMNAKKRGQVIKEFEIPAPEGPTILLASLKASGAGINLTAASRVYLLEPWWNPAVEEQAMDRVHRIGQKEDVKIVRMIARSTIEERILELQEKKKLLARKAFGKKGSKDQRDISLDDLRTLMHL